MFTQLKMTRASTVLQFMHQEIDLPPLPGPKGAVVQQMTNPALAAGLHKLL